MSVPAEVMLSEEVSKFYNDPLGHVHWSYPWGVAGTPLAEPPFDSIDTWQEDVLGELGQWCSEGQEGYFWSANASGHGIGKGALMAMLAKWFIDTRYMGKGVITANTGDQLSGKTWAELAFWHRMSMTKSLYEWAATKYYRIGFKDTWFVDAQTWSDKNSDAFSGLHARDVFMGFDEASGIPDEIWQAARGSMSTPGAIWIVFGNPVRGKGQFRECFHRFKNRWRRRQIDSRSAKFADNKWAAQVIEDYGVDSDISRVRVLGQFPYKDWGLFFDSQEISDAKDRDPTPREYEGYPRIMAIDSARGGANKNVIARRQGPKTWPFIKFDSKLKGPEFAAEVQLANDDFKADVILADAGGGYGWSLIDSAEQMGITILPIKGAAKSHNEKEYYNLRAEMYGLFRKWLHFGQIPNDQDLYLQMESLESGWAKKGEHIVIVIELKESMDVSPDEMDALALTFARKIELRTSKRARKRPPSNHIV